MDAPGHHRTLPLQCLLLRGSQGCLLWKTLQKAPWNDPCLQTGSLCPCSQIRDFLLLQNIKFQALWDPLITTISFTLDDLIIHVKFNSYMRNIYKWRGQRNSWGLTLSDLLWETENFFIHVLFFRTITFCIYWVFWEFSPSFEKFSQTAFLFPMDILAFLSVTCTIRFCWTSIDCHQSPQHLLKHY